MNDRSLRLFPASLVVLRVFRLQYPVGFICMFLKKKKIRAAVDAPRSMDMEYPTAV